MMLLALLAALAVNSNTTSATAGSGATTASATTGYSFTNTAGTLLLVCAEASSGGGTATDVTAVTYGGVSMTLGASSTAKIRWDTGNASVASLWYLLSPATGANTVSMTVTSAALVGWISGAISFTGNDGTTPIRTTAFTATGNSTKPGVSVTGTTSGNIIVDCMGTGSGVTSATAPSTNIWIKNVNGNSGGNNAASSRSAGTGASVTMAYTVTLDIWGTVAVEVQAAGGAPAGPVESGMRGFWGLFRPLWKENPTWLALR